MAEIPTSLTTPTDGEGGDIVPRKCQSLSAPVSLHEIWIHPSLEMDLKENLMCKSSPSIWTAYNVLSQNDTMLPWSTQLILSVCTS